jgi:hypothetical protein
MLRVYFLSEDDFDDQVYLYVLEMLLSRRVEALPIRLRRGGGIGEVRKKLPLLLSDIRRTGQVDGTYFLIGIDNDRALEHPTHQPGAHSGTETCRHCRVMTTIHEGMPDGWPIPGALALPVQMIESWLLLMCDARRYPRESALPPCARRDQSAARRLFGAKPPDQLKDLVDAEQRSSGAPTKADFALTCIVGLDVNDLAARSPSFDRFRGDVAAWKAAATG